LLKKLLFFSVLVSLKLLSWV